MSYMFRSALPSFGNREFDSQLNMFKHKVGKLGWFSPTNPDFCFHWEIPTSDCRWKLHRKTPPLFPPIKARARVTHAAARARKTQCAGSPLDTVFCRSGARVGFPKTLSGTDSYVLALLLNTSAGIISVRAVRVQKKCEQRDFTSVHDRGYILHKCSSDPVNFVRSFWVLFRFHLL